MSVEYKIVNIVSSSSLNVNLDLKAIKEMLKDVGDIEVKYDPERFPGLILKKNNMSVLLFRNGKMVVAGAKSIEEVKEALKYVLRLLTPFLGEVPEKVRVEIQNMVVSGNLGSNIDLEILAEKKGAVYDPEQFPGVRLSLYSVSGGKSPCTALIFSNGRFVLVGCRKEEDIKDSVKVLEEITKDPSIKW